MDQIFDCIYRALIPRVIGLTPSDIRTLFDGWEFIKVTRKDVLVGVILRKQTELHIIIDPKYQTTICFLHQSKKIIADTIAKYGYAETKVVLSYDVGHRLAKMLGFKQTDIGDYMVQYEKRN